MSEIVVVLVVSTPAYRPERPKSKSDSRVWLMFCALMVPLLSACEESAPETAYRLDLDMKQFMNLVLEPASDVVWESAGYVVTMEGEENLAPTDDEGWAKVQAAGAMIAESGNLLMLPGRAAQTPDWTEFSNALTEMGHQVMAAAEAQDEDATFKAGADLYSVCVACHQVHATHLR